MKNTEKFVELEKIVLKHFPGAEWNQKDQRWESKTTPNKKDEWEKPETLEKFDEEASAEFYSYMTGSMWDNEGNISIGVRSKIFENLIASFETFANELNERLEFQHSDAPDAKGRFRELGIHDLADWLIKTRKGDMRKIVGSLNQQANFNRRKDPQYAAKMDKVREAVKRKLNKDKK